MLQIAEKYHIEESTKGGFKSESKKDVSASQVTDVGQRMLKRHIEARLGTSQRGEVTWPKY